MEDTDLRKTFDPLYADIRPETQFAHSKPLLAHYTTIQTVELILKNKQMWFANPLYMNDLEEVRFGLIEGEKAVFSSADLTAALGTPERRNLFMRAFNFYGVDYIENYLNDTYVLCFSEHDPADNDGRLSMWRGYGGNGRCAAIVIDTAKFSTADAAQGGYHQGERQPATALSGGGPAKRAPARHVGKGVHNGYPPAAVGYRRIRTASKEREGGWLGAQGSGGSPSAILSQRDANAAPPSARDRPSGTRRVLSRRDSWMYSGTPAHSRDCR